jgi:O-antigen biosynthesis protein
VLRRCPVCGQRNAHFRPLASFYAENWRTSGFPYSAGDFETLNVADYACSSCGASDRDRLCALWLARNVRRRASLLDVGPSAPLSGFLRPRFDYTSLDTLTDADVNADVQALPFADGSFDMVLCSHVLEHVRDDRLALRELRRVLRRGGRGLVLVPICLTAAAISEDPDVDEASAWQRFGQGDHVRLYDRGGFIGRVREASFDVEEWRPRVLDRIRHAFARGSVLYIVG